MTGLIILAAGESSRMGQPKQNLLFQNKTLLQRAIETGLQSKCRPVLVVLGANADEVEHTLGECDVRFIYNKDWKEGIASSIRIAVTEMLEDLSIDGAVFMLCDQPFADANLLNDILQKKADTNCPVIASFYDNTVGVPALFDKSIFPELLLLSGDNGAKKIIMNHAKDTTQVFFDLGSIDIDTQAGYLQLLNQSNLFGG